MGIFTGDEGWENINPTINPLKKGQSKETKMPKEIEHKGKKIKLFFQPIFFEPYLTPNGFLTKDLACHAMFYAYIIAQANVKEIQEKLFYDNEEDQVYNFRDLFKTIATIYNVDPDKMWNYKFLVEQQMRALFLKTIPAEYFTQNKVTRGTNATIFDNPVTHDSQKHWEEVLKNATRFKKH